MGRPKVFSSTTLWSLFSAGLVVNGLRLRGRIAAIDVLAPSGAPAAPHHRFVTAAGVTLDPATRQAASEHALRNGLDVVDLVPADLAAEQLLDLVRLIDPSTYRDDPLVPARCAGHALLVSDDVVRRARIDTFEGLDALEMLRLAVVAKLHAPRSTSLALAPSLQAVPPDSSTRIPCLQEMFTVATPVVVAVLGAELALLAGGAAGRRKPAALAAAAAYSVQPLLAVAGTAAHPRDLPRRAPVRIAASLRDLVVALVRARRDTGLEDDLDARRAEYDELIAGGIERFLEPARHDCPLCGSTDLFLRVRTPDLMQGKPGRFQLDECGDCGHVFQNPRLTPEGLDFYYRDFYDGFGEQESEAMFSTGAGSYEGRAKLVAGATEPRHWLDVGSGHGHFCLAAREHLPKTTFDGLDMSAAIDEAERRGWIDQGYRGSFPDLAADLAGHYDVVSMHHYLEHTRDPRAELVAAAQVLQPGGFLLIEQPDPASFMARRLGRWWGPWFQPQHQHMLSAENLQSLLRSQGFTVVAVQRAEPHQPCDLAFSVYLRLNHRVPRADVPWRGPSSTADRVRRHGGFLLTAPLLVAAFVVDTLLAPIITRLGGSNAYRILARRPLPPEEATGNG